MHDIYKCLMMIYWCFAINQYTIKYINNNDVFNMNVLMIWDECLILINEDQCWIF